MLFSAALAGARGRGSDAFDLLRELAACDAVTLVTSAHCVHEARVNLERKRPAGIDALVRLVARCERVDGAPVPSRRSAALLPADDALVLDAASAGACDALVTGDRRHLGPLMTRADLGLRVRTLRDFLLEGPPQAPSGGAAGSGSGAGASAEPP